MQSESCNIPLERWDNQANSVSVQNEKNFKKLLVIWLNAVCQLTGYLKKKGCLQDSAGQRIEESKKSNYFATENSDAVLSAAEGERREMQ